THRVVSLTNPRPDYLVVQLDLFFRNEGDTTLGCFRNERDDHLDSPIQTRTFRTLTEVRPYSLDRAIIADNRITQSRQTLAESHTCLTTLCGIEVLTVSRAYSTTKACRC